MLHSILEKLQLKDEKNLLIQGLPSSIEKQFAKLNFAKNMTPLLRSRKIDFALVFAVNETQLGNIIAEVSPAMQKEAKLWVAYPKLASKIATTLNRDCSWECLKSAGYEKVTEVTLDHVWTAIHFQKIKAGHNPVAPLIEESFVMEEELILVDETLATSGPAAFRQPIKERKTSVSASKKQRAKSY
ncbi:MAG: hypothetical protein JST58_00895 [Bacteroidetes bacterium]|nr:hypothetical protein [Bacteroidota bacterium]